MSGPKTGPEPGRFLHRVRVAYADTDQGGIAHHTAYFRWFEAARIEFLRAHGLEYRTIEYDERLALPVAKAEIRYRRPARFDDVVNVECWVAKLGHAFIHFGYRAFRDDLLLTEADVTLACIRLPEGRVCALPGAITKALTP